MVRLDGLLALCLLDALQNVGVNGSLCQELNALQLASLVGEYLDKLLADDLSLALGVRNAGEQIQEAIGSVNVDQVCVQLVAENFNNVFGLVLSHQAMVNVDADQLLSDCLDEQCGDNGAVNAAGQCQQYLFISDLRANGCDLFFDEGACELGGRDACHGFRSYIWIHKGSS